MWPHGSWRMHCSEVAQTPSRSAHPRLPPPIRWRLPHRNRFTRGPVRGRLRRCRFPPLRSLRRQCRRAPRPTAGAAGRQPHRRSGRHHRGARLACEHRGAAVRPAGAPRGAVDQLPDGRRVREPPHAQQVVHFQPPSHDHERPQRRQRVLRCRIRRIEDPTVSPVAGGLKTGCEPGGAGRADRQSVLAAPARRATRPAGHADAADRRRSGSHRRAAACGAVRPTRPSRVALRHAAHRVGFGRCAYTSDGRSVSRPVHDRATWEGSA